MGYTEMMRSVRREQLPLTGAAVVYLLLHARDIFRVGAWRYWRSLSLRAKVLLGGIVLHLTREMKKRVTCRSLAGEVVVVTGAGSGIGRLLSLWLANMGAKVAIWDVNSNAAYSVLKEVRVAGGVASAHVVDVTDRGRVYEAASETIQSLGEVTFLINNAGIVSGREFVNTEDKQVSRTLSVNTAALFWTTKAFLPSMLARKHGHLITISSAAGLTGAPGLVDYSASKFGAVGYHEALALELWNKRISGIRTTLVCPCMVDTGMFHGARTRFPFLLPVLSPEYVVAKILWAAQCGEDVLYIPRFLYLAQFLKASLPTSLAFWLSHVLGVNSMMETFEQTRPAA